MANEVALYTADKIEVVESIIQFSGVSGAALTAGSVVRQDIGSGQFVHAAGDTAPHARAWGIATKSKNAARLGVTIIRKGVLDGYDLEALDYDAPIYLSDTTGRLSTVAGSQTVLVGRVIAGNANLTGSSAHKLLYVDL